MRADCLAVIRKQERTLDNLPVTSYKLLDSGTPGPTDHVSCGSGGVQRWTKPSHVLLSRSNIFMSWMQEGIQVDVSATFLSSLEATLTALEMYSDVAADR